MLVANIFLRALDDNGPIYAPYSFEGDWTKEDKALVGSVMDTYAPERVDATYNNWQLNCYGSHFSARRATWDMEGLYATSAAGLAEKLASYYVR